MADFGSASAAIGLFGTCLHAYRAVATAIEFGSDAVIWDVQMRIERFRFEIWARMLGFLDAKTGHEVQISNGRSKPESFRGGGIFSDILQIREVQDIVTKALRAVKGELDEFDKIVTKYHLKPGQDLPQIALNEDYESLKRRSWWKDDSMRKTFKKLPSKTREFTMRLALVMKDPKTVEDLLARLSTLNDGLEKILSMAQKHQANEALLSAVLSHYNEPSTLSAVTKSITSAVIPTAQIPSRTAELVSTAVVKQEIVAPQVTASHYRRAEKANNNTSSREIPPNQVNVHGDIETTKREYFWPLSTATCSLNAGEGDGAEVQILQIIVEWRTRNALANGSDLERLELARRGDLIVDLLHRTSGMPGADDYRVLDCIGYVRRNDARFDGERIEVVGLVSLMPPWADVDRGPVTLHQLLSRSFASTEPGAGAPSLRTRFALARVVATALYRLQCSHWLHRNLASQNIVLFYDRASGDLRLDEPYLAGLQYSRPDDLSGSEDDPHVKPFSEGHEQISPAMALYLHPDFSSRTDRGRRYRRSDDVYSLGIVLLEIAMWEPVQCYLRGGHDVFEAVEQIRLTAEKELAIEVGEMYSDATLACLNGLHMVSGESNKRMEDSDKDRTKEDSEIGIETNLYWRVVQEIGKCNV